MYDFGNHRTKNKLTGKKCRKRVRMNVGTVRSINNQSNGSDDWKRIHTSDGTKIRRIDKQGLKKDKRGISQ